MITHIAFDVGDVLIYVGDFSPYLKYLVKSLDFQTNTETLIKNYFSILPDLELGKTTIQTIFPNMPVSKVEEIYKSIADKFFRNNLPILKLANGLKKRYRVGVLSNVDLYFADTKINQDIYRQFNPVVLSCREKTRKPEKGIYEIYLKRANCQPQDLVFIDNNPINLPPAREMGIKTVLFQNFDQLKNELIKLGIDLA